MLFVGICTSVLNDKEFHNNTLWANYELPEKFHYVSVDSSTSLSAMLQPSESSNNEQRVAGDSIEGEDSPLHVGLIRWTIAKMHSNEVVLND